MIKEKLDDMLSGPSGSDKKQEWAGDVAFIDCMQEICVFGKKEE